MLKALPWPKSHSFHLEQVLAAKFFPTHHSAPSVPSLLGQKDEQGSSWPRGPHSHVGTQAGVPASRHFLFCPFLCNDSGVLGELLASNPQSVHPPGSLSPKSFPVFSLRATTFYSFFPWNNIFTLLLLHPLPCPIPSTRSSNDYLRLFTYTSSELFY